LPGRLNLAIKQGDELGQLLDFSVDLSAHTFSANVLSTVTGEGLMGLNVTAVNLAAGQVNIGLSEVYTATMAAGTYAWQLAWVAPGSVRRTAMEGLFEVVR
jgi:hypothetical protein